MELALWVLLCCVSVSRAERHTVFWNSTNPKFQEDVYSVQVRLNDYLDIVCPHYPQGTVPSQEAERYVLYMVELEDFETCRPQSYEQMRWECGQPFALHAPEKFSEKFQRFTPFTLGKEFRPGQSYYYISKPLHHHGQECLKLRVDVIANDGSQEARVGPGKGSRGGGHTTSNHLPADDPVVLPVQKNAPPNCAVRPAFLTIIPALLPFFLLLVVQ